MLTIKHYHLHLAAVDLLQQYNHCVAEALPVQQVNWLPHPTVKEMANKRQSLDQS